MKVAESLKAKTLPCFFLKNIVAKKMRKISNAYLKFIEREKTYNLTFKSLTIKEMFFYKTKAPSLF